MLILKSWESWKTKLDDTLTTEWTYDPKLKSNLDIGKLVKPLCSELFMENDSVDKSGFRCEPIGIGSDGTWHGIPDMRATIQSEIDDAMTYIVVSEVDVVEVEDEEVEDDFDPGNSVYIEGKKNMFVDLLKVTSQVVATTVVVSFTNHERCSEITITPVLLVCKRRVRVCMYDCVQDTLLFSSITLLESDGKINPMGLLLIWIILHWR